MGGKPVLYRVPGRPKVVVYPIYLVIIILLIFHLRTPPLPPLKLIWFRKGVYGVSEGGDNKGGRLGIRGGLRPCCTPTESGAIHAFENIRVYIEYSHC